LGKTSNPRAEKQYDQGPEAHKLRHTVGRGPGGRSNNKKKEENSVEERGKKLLKKGGH